VEYIDIVKDIIDNFCFTSTPNSFSNEGAPDHNGEPLSGDPALVAMPHDFFSAHLLQANFYRLRKHYKSAVGIRDEWVKSGRTYFHDVNLINFLRNYKKVEHVSFEDAMKSDKKVILEMELHACSMNPKSYESIKEKFFDKLFLDRDILQKMRDGKFFIFLYYGFEADDMTVSTKPKDKFKCLYEMFETVLSEYNLPSNSLFILSSNLNGYEQEKEYNFKKSFVNVIFENATEFQSFKHIPLGGFSDYTFDEHIHNMRNSDKRLLRISRTRHPHRDCMLYFLEQNNYIDDSIIEQSGFSGDYLNGFYSKKEFIDGRGVKDPDIIRKIKEQIPYVASRYEKKYGLSGKHPPNEAIPFDVYKKTIFSWASLSLPDQLTKVFINMSTFNPVLHFHPILWLGESNFIKKFKESGYKSFDWLFDESYDKIVDPNNSSSTGDMPIEKWNIHMKGINKVMSFDRDYLVNIIIDNRDTLEHNQNLLYKCKSIEKIFRKFHSIVSS